MVARRCCPANDTAAAAAEAGLALALAAAAAGEASDADVLCRAAGVAQPVAGAVPWRQRVRALPWLPAHAARSAALLSAAPAWQLAAAEARGESRSQWVASLALRAEDGAGLSALLEDMDSAEGGGADGPEPASGMHADGDTVPCAAAEALVAGRLLLLPHRAPASVVAALLGRRAEDAAAPVLPSAGAAAAAAAKGGGLCAARDDLSESRRAALLLLHRAAATAASTAARAPRLDVLALHARALLASGPASVCCGCGAAGAAERLAALGAMCAAEEKRCMRRAPGASARSARRAASCFEHYLERRMPTLAAQPGMLAALARLGRH